MVPPAFTPSAFGTSPKFNRGDPFTNPKFNFEFGGGRVGVSECAVTGAHVFLTANLHMLLRKRPGGGDFTVCPVALHRPATFWTVEQLLVFTLSYRT